MFVSSSLSLSSSLCERVIFAPLLWFMSPFLSGVIFSCFSNTVFNDFPFILLVTNTHAIFHCWTLCIVCPKEEQPTSILPKLILMPEPWSHAKMREEALASCCCCCWMEEKKCEREQKIVRVITVFLNDAFFFSRWLSSESHFPGVIHSIQWIFLFPSHPLSVSFALTFSCFFLPNGRSFVRHKSSLFAFDLCACDARHTKTVYTADLFFLPKWFKWTRLKNNEYKSIESSKSFNVVAARISTWRKKCWKLMRKKTHSISSSEFQFTQSTDILPSHQRCSVAVFALRLSLSLGKKSLPLNRRHRNHG